MTDQSKPKTKKKNPVTEKKRQQAAGGEDGIITLSTGIRARISPVAASLIADVTTAIKEPEVPTWFNAKKEREEPNPHDPEYLKALSEANYARSKATMDTMVLFGVDLVDGVPDDGWEKKLAYLKRLGHIDLDGFNLDDEVDREFVYKRYVAVSADDLTFIMSRSGITQEAIAAAAESFPSPEV